MRFSGDALTHCVETHEIEGASVKVFSVAKTIADLFKYRNKVGLDVALEALREAVRTRRATVDELWQSARVCRMQRVIQPFAALLT